MRIVQRSGRLLVATSLAMALTTATVFATPGKLDQGFGDRGVVITPTAPGSGADFQNGLAIQPDDRILVAGASDMGPAAGGFQWRIARYTKQGTLDSSFGTDGTVTTSMSAVGGDDEHIWRLALQPDGKIVAVGQALTATSGIDFALARYNPNGTLDSSFGEGGRVTTAIGPGANRDTAFSVRVDTAGKIVVAGFATMASGSASRAVALVRYNADGTPDSSFGTGGVVVTDIALGRLDQGKDMAIDATGRIVVVGMANMGPGAGGFNFALARYNPDGTLDTSFDSDGVVTTAMAPGDNFDLAQTLGIDANGEIVVGGAAEVGGFIFDLALARYHPDGSLDNAFGTGGKVTTNAGPANSDDDLEGLIIHSTGKILIGGSTAPTALGVDSDFMVARYDADGTLDGTFGLGGIVITPTGGGGGSDEIYDIALLGDSKLVASGECDQPVTGRDVCLVRYKVGEAD